MQSWPPRESDPRPICREEPRLLNKSMTGRVDPARGRKYTRIVEPREPAFLTVSLDPNPTIDAYKRDVDRSLLRENLRLTTTERVRKMIAALRFAETVRASRVKAGAP